LKARNRHPLPSKEAAAIRESLKDMLSDRQADAILAEPLEKAVSDSWELILSRGEPVVLSHEGRNFPALRGFLRIQVDRSFVKVDMGAVPYVVKGADIMSPGVVAVDRELRKGDWCIVTEERHNKPLAIAEMLVDGAQVDSMDRGKVARNIHYVGDKLWDIDTA
jgi:PUA-domain protein